MSAGRERRGAPRRRRREARAAALLVAAALAALVASPAAVAASPAASAPSPGARPRAPALAAEGRARAAVDTAAGPRLLALAPARAGDLLVCNVTTAGLPGERIVGSLRSGLVSAIDLDLELLDGKEKVVAGNRLTLRLAFDLWEEIFAVESRGERRLFTDLAALQEFLAELRALPVAPLEALGRDERFRLRAGLSLRPVAPSEIARVDEAIGAAPAAQETRGGGGQEVSVSLGRLIRLFYRGESGRAEPAARAVSDWFRPGELQELRDEQD